MEGSSIEWGRPPSADGDANGSAADSSHTARPQLRVSRVLRADEIGDLKDESECQAACIRARAPRCTMAQAVDSPPHLTSPHLALPSLTQSNSRTQHHLDQLERHRHRRRRHMAPSKLRPISRRRRSRDRVKIKIRILTPTDRTRWTAGTCTSL